MILSSNTVTWNIILHVSGKAGLAIRSQSNLYCL